MEKTVLQPASVAPPQGPYSQAVWVTGKTTIYVAGQTAVNAQGGLVGKGDMRAQLRQAHENIRAILAAAGASFDNVVRTTTFVTDMEAYRGASDLRREMLKGYFPPNTVVEVRRLAHEDFLVEIEATAVV